MLTPTKPTRHQNFLGAIWSSIAWGSLDRLTALAKHIFIASAIGLTPELDAFYMANGFITLFVTSWSHIADVIAVPKLVELIKLGKEREVRKMSGDLFAFSCFFSALITILLSAGWPLVCQLAWGFDEHRRELLLDAILWSEPLVLLTIPISMLYSFAKARRAFSLRYRNDFITSVVILACVMLYPEATGVLLWSFSLGTIISFLIALTESRGNSALWGNPFSPSVTQLLPLAPALLVFYAIEHAYSLTNRQFVSFLPHGAVSAIAYAWTLAKLPPSLMRIEGAFMTFYAEGTTALGTRSLITNNLISSGIFVGAGLSLIMWEFSEPFISLVLEHGKFNRTDTELVAHCTGYFGLAMIPFLLMPALGQICQVERQMKILMRRTLFGLLINIAGCTISLFVLEWGAEGIALSSAISQWGMLLASMTLIRKVGVKINYAGHIFWLVTVTCYALAALSVTRSIHVYFEGATWLAIPESICLLALFALPVLTGRGHENQITRSLIARSIAKIKRP